MNSYVKLFTMYCPSNSEAIYYKHDPIHTLDHYLAVNSSVQNRAKMADLQVQTSTYFVNCAVLNTAKKAECVVRLLTSYEFYHLGQL